MAAFPHMRFEKMIQQQGKCWLWKGSKKGFTTGSRRDGTRRKTAAHVFSYRWYEGPVPPGMVVYRTCRTLGCVYHGHQAVGTRSDMVRHAVKRKRWTQGRAENFPDTRGERNGRAKLNDKQVAEIFLAKGTVKAVILARRFPVTETTIYSIWKGTTRKEVTQHGR